MNIDVYSIQRNESKILPYFLRHYSTFARHIFIFDDNSTDGSRDIIRSYYPNTSTLTPRFHGVNDPYFRDTYQTAYWYYSSNDDTWVICVDGDEFVYHPNLISVLSDAQQKGIKLIHCEGYNMFADSFPTTSGQIYDEVKFGVRDPWYNKPIIVDSKTNVSWALGRHSLNKKMPVPFSLGIKLLHYHYLGPEYCRDRLDSTYLRFPTEELKERHGKHVTGETYLHSMQWYEDNKSKAVQVIP